jgi:hypothetical protein
VALEESAEFTPSKTGKVTEYGQHASNLKTYHQTGPRLDYLRNVDKPVVNQQTHLKMLVFIEDLQV